MILIVDDDPSVRTSIVQRVQPEGWIPYECENGEEALRAFQELGNKITVVLMDVEMPIMDGVIARRKMREVRADVPIILMSGKPQDVEGPFLLKPFSRVQLLGMLPTS